MIIKNYNRQNHFHLEDGTVIKGVVKMDYSEWCDAYAHLVKEHTKAIKKVETYKRDALGYAIRQFERRKPFSIGIAGTFEIVKKYSLDKYKNQNYAIVIK